MYRLSYAHNDKWCDGVGWWSSRLHSKKSQFERVWARRNEQLSIIQNFIIAKKTVSSLFIFFLYCLILESINCSSILFRILLLICCIRKLWFKVSLMDFVALKILEYMRIPQIDSNCVVDGSKSFSCYTVKSSISILLSLSHPAAFFSTKLKCVWYVKRKKIAFFAVWSDENVIHVFTWFFLVDHRFFS